MKATNVSDIPLPLLANDALLTDPYMSNTL
jgi:hypothetical protein